MLWNALIATCSLFTLLLGWCEHTASAWVWQQQCRQQGQPGQWLLLCRASPANQHWPYSQYKLNKTNEPKQKLEVFLLISSACWTKPVSQWLLLLAEEWTVMLAEEWTVTLAEKLTVTLAEEWAAMLAEEWTVTLAEEWTAMLIEEWTVMLAEKLTVTLAEEWAAMLAEEWTVTLAEKLTVTLAEEWTGLSC